MIVIDTSALLSIIIGESTRDACLSALEADSVRLLSAGTLVEAFVVCRRKRLDGIEDLVRALEPTIIPVDEEAAWLAQEAYRRWGIGSHPARLNFGDCFAYVVARHFDCPLLYIGNDFSQTDIRSAL